MSSIEGLYNYGDYALTAESMDQMPALRVISNFRVGVDHIDLQGAKERGIPVGNLRAGLERKALLSRIV